MIASKIDRFMDKYNDNIKVKIEKYLPEKAYVFLKKGVQQKHRFFYNRHLYRSLKHILEERKSEGLFENDLDLLQKLHELFPPHRTLSYNFNAIIHRARGRFDKILKQGILLKGMDVLDIGAGHGENLFLCDEYEFDSATGVDHSAERFYSHTNRLSVSLKNRITFIEGDLLRMSLPAESYDFIISINSFEHFANPKIVIDESYKILRPNGYFYIDFGPLFRSPFGAHRYRYIGVPYIQNLFSDEIAYHFLYNKLKINPGINTYTGAEIKDRDPYIEMNKWCYQQFEQLFKQDGRWDVVRFNKECNYKYHWMTEVFDDELMEFSQKDLFVTELTVILQKKDY